MKVNGGNINFSKSISTREQLLKMSRTAGKFAPAETKKKESEKTVHDNVSLSSEPLTTEQESGAKEARSSSPHSTKEKPTTDESSKKKPNTSPDRFSSTLLMEPERQGVSDANAEFFHILGKLEKTYPGISLRVADLERKAKAEGYHPSKTPGLESEIVQDKPWSTKKWDPAGIERYKEARKAKHPELNTTDVKNYDMEAALEVKDEVISDLYQMFPRDKYPGFSIAARAKSRESLAGKLLTKAREGRDYKIGDATDLVGARVITPNVSDLKEVTQSIEKKYGDSIIEKTNYYENPKGPYRAIHYIVDINGQPTEIQVSTQNMRIAFDAYHDTCYKYDPKNPLSDSMKARFEGIIDKAIYLDGLEYSRGKKVKLNTKTGTGVT